MDHLTVIIQIIVIYDCHMSVFLSSQLFGHLVGYRAVGLGAVPLQHGQHHRLQAK